MADEVPGRGRFHVTPDGRLLAFDIFARYGRKTPPGRPWRRTALWNSGRVLKKSRCDGHRQSEALNPASGKVLAGILPKLPTATFRHAKTGSTTRQANGSRSPAQLEAAPPIQNLFRSRDSQGMRSVRKRGVSAERSGRHHRIAIGRLCCHNRRMATISEALAIAVQHYQAGRLQAAEQICRQILQVEPNQADAIHLLGLIAHQAGKDDGAVQYIGRAIGLGGNVAAFHNSLGEAYRALRRIPEAVASYRRALERKPDYAEADGIYRASGAGTPVKPGRKVRRDPSSN